MKYKPDHLFEYGIQTEKTTHRIHVDVTGRVIFVYQTQDGINSMPEPINIFREEDWEANGYYLVSPKWLDVEYIGYATSRGIRIPYLNIDMCRGVKIPESIVFKKQLTTSKKGKLAVKITKDMFRLGKIPLHLKISEVNNKSDQIIGKDIDIGECVIQVKHDDGCFRKGMFLQTHEWNPEKMY